MTQRDRTCDTCGQLQAPSGGNQVILTVVVGPLEVITIRRYYCSSHCAQEAGPSLAAWAVVAMALMEAAP